MSIEQQRTRMMLNKLYDQVQRDCIGNEWAEKFICDMHEKSKLDYFPFSQKQLDKIEELFERY